MFIHDAVYRSTGHSPGLTLELAELLGGPRGESFGFVGFGSSSLSEQVVNLGTNLHQLHHIFTECRTQVTTQREREKEILLK